MLFSWSEHNPAGLMQLTVNGNGMGWLTVKVALCKLQGLQADMILVVR